jgi:hypothetical protein
MRRVTPGANELQLSAHQLVDKTTQLLLCKAPHVKPSRAERDDDDLRDCVVRRQPDVVGLGPGDLGSLEVAHFDRIALKRPVIAVGRIERSGLACIDMRSTAART